MAKTEAKKETKTVTEDEKKFSLKEWFKNLRIVKWFRVNWKGFLIGFGSGAGTAAAGYGIYKVATRHNGSDDEEIGISDESIDYSVVDVTSEHGEPIESEE